MKEVGAECRTAEMVWTPEKHAGLKMHITVKLCPISL
jgi:hypothetical protein